MSGPQTRLKAGEVVLVTVGMPMPVALFADILTALAEIAKKHDYEPPVLLADGSNRVITRERHVP